MRKILTKCFSLVAMLACIVTLASCVAVSSNTSIQINKFPEETYVVGSERGKALADIEISIYENGVEIKEGTLEALEEVVSIQGFSLKNVGTFTAKITYGSATVSFTYTVVADSSEVSTEEELESVFNDSSENIIAITITSDIELTEKVEIPENKKVILDLNEKTLSVSEEFEEECLIYVPNSASLEVKGNGVIENTTVLDLNCLLVVDGELIIRNGSIIDYSQTFVGANHNGAVLMLNATGTLTIYDGTFQSLTSDKSKPYGKAVLYLNSGSTTKIYDGEFYQDSEDGSGWVGSYLVQSIGSLFVYGGEFESTRGVLALVGGQFDVRGGKFTAHKYYAAYVTGAYEIVNGIISGGTFINDGVYAAVYTANGSKEDGGKGKASSLVVTGGTFECASYGFVLYYGNLAVGNLVIEGGTYKSGNSNAKLSNLNAVPEGYAVEKIADGHFEVKPE